MLSTTTEQFELVINLRVENFTNKRANENYQASKYSPLKIAKETTVQPPCPKQKRRKAFQSEELLDIKDSLIKKQPDFLALRRE